MHSLLNTPFENQKTAVIVPRRRTFMITAISVCDDKIAPTLGQTEMFLLINDQQEMRIPCAGNIPLLLKQNQVDLLICCGIGNCMADLLDSMGIRMIPGVSGTVDDVKKQYFSGTLKPGIRYSCADHGQTCGACSGTF